MKSRVKLSIIALVVMLLLSGVCMFFANRIQTDGGKVEISEGTLATPEGNLVYKLYKPKTASASNKAPAVLLLHGYQNDHETCAAYAIELARRGAVVVALDEYGHGYTSIGLINRGYVNHKVTVNYGNDSASDKTYVEVSDKGAKRYRLMMNFSNLSFFNPHYSADSAGNTITDSSCGGVAAYAWMSTLEYVDNTRMALSGHSMGTWSSWSVAAAFSGTAIEPKATVLQCGELFRVNDAVYDTSKYHFNNVLLLQAKWDEFSYFRDYQKTVSDELLSTPLREEFLGINSRGEWNKTYGSFADGSARRMELLYTNHRLTTHHKGGLETALEWFDRSITLNSPLPYSNITAITKEYLVLASMLLVLFAMFPLMSILTATPLFAGAITEKPSEYDIPKAGSRIRGALITILLSFATFPFMTQLGHGLLPLPENIFRMTVGNGFMCWYLTLIIIMLITTLISRIKAKKAGRTPEKFNLKAFILGLLLAVIMAGLVYLMNILYYALFDLDLRFIWPFFRPFNTERAVQFGVYIPVFAIFYLMNNTKIMRDMRIKATYREGIGGFIVNWLHNFVLMAGGVILVVLLEYIPFFLNLGPGADLLFGSTFGGPFMSILILFVPQVMFFSFLCTFCYRKTGKVYAGALLAAILACWIVTGGSAIL